MHTEIYPEIGNVIVPNLFLINTHEKTSTIGEKRETIIAVLKNTFHESWILKLNLKIQSLWPYHALI